MSILQKSVAMDFIKFDDGSEEARNLIVYRHPVEDFSSISQLNVEPTQAAIFVNEGEMTAPFLAGHYTLSDSNNSAFSLFSKWKRSFTNGESTYHCKVFFINLLPWRDLKFGTLEPIAITDPETGLSVNVGARGFLGVRIDNRDLDGRGAMLFFKNVSGQENSFSKDDLEHWLRTTITKYLSDHLNRIIDETQTPLLEISRHLRKLSDIIKDEFTQEFEQYGLIVEDFSFVGITPDAESRELINKNRALLYQKRIEAQAAAIEAQGSAAKMTIESQALAAKRAREGYSYQDERGFDVMNTAAGNEAQPGAFMGAGMGLGMGLGMGAGMGGAMGNMAQNTMGSMGGGVTPPNANNPYNNANNPYQDSPQNVGKPCPNCGNNVPPNTKFCPNCGAKQVEEMHCSNCGSLINANAKFCPNCGTPVMQKEEHKHCSNCGVEVPSGTKFCPNCGAKIE